MRLLGSMNKGCFAYSTTAFANTLMHSIFMFFYVKIFIDFYHVSNWWFQVSQVFFMIWNTLNDPLFGYFQDNSNWKCLKSRRLSILYGAPLFAVSFLIPWFPWANYEPGSWLCGVHLMFALFCYDALFTFVLLAYCCLFAEMSTSYKDRLNMKWCSVVASLCAFWSVPLCNYFSDNLVNMTAFRVYVVVIAVIACYAMVYTGRNAHTIYDMQSASRAYDGGVVGSGESQKQYQGSVLKLTFEILRDRDFLAFVSTNFCHLFHSVFLSNFTAIFVDYLAPITAFQKSLFFALLFILPQLLIIFGKNWILHFGYYRVILCSIIFTTVLSFSVYIIGASPNLYLTFLLVDTVLVHASFSLFDLVLSDICDKDKEKHARSHPISSMVFGTNALVTKPAISLSPMVTVAVLNYYGYHQLISKAAGGGTTMAASSEQTGQQHSPAVAGVGLSVSPEMVQLKSVMFLLSCAIPFMIGIIQLFTWSWYSIRSSHRSADYDDFKEKDISLLS